MGLLWCQLRFHINKWCFTKKKKKVIFLIFSFQIQDLRPAFQTGAWSQPFWEPARLKWKGDSERVCRSLTYSSTNRSLKDPILPTMSYPDVIPGQTNGSSHKLNSCATALGVICKLLMKVCSPVVSLGHIASWVYRYSILCICLHLVGLNQFINKEGWKLKVK